MEIKFRENDVLIEKKSFGCGYDECCTETKYLIVAINTEKNKVKVQPFAKRNTVVWGADCSSNEFRTINEKAFWANVRIDKYDGVQYLINLNKDFCYRNK